MHATIISEKGTMNLKEIGEGYLAGFGRRKEKGDPQEKKVPIKNHINETCRIPEHVHT